MDTLMMKKFGLTLLLFLFSLVFTCFLGEFLVRLIAPQRLVFSPAMFVSDDTLVYKMQPNYHASWSNFEFEGTVTTNAIGFREREIGPKQQGTLRILGLGDSFTFGNGVNQDSTFLKHLERCLNGLGNRTNEVLNFGIPGYSVLQEYRLWRMEQATLQPDVVLLAFFVGNDFVDSADLYDSTGRPTIRIVDGHMISNKASDVEYSLIRRYTKTVRYYLSTHSHFYVLLRNRGSELLSKLHLHQFTYPPEFCEQTYSPRMETAWNQIKSILTEFSDEVRQRNQRLVVLIIPTSYQVYSESWNNYLKGLELDPAQYDLDKPQRILKDFLREKNVECVDVLPVLRSKISGPPLFFTLDSHLTPEGHRVVGEVLCDYLSQGEQHASVAEGGPPRSGL
jgi:hypothetical protein